MWQAEIVAWEPNQLFADKILSNGLRQLMRQVESLSRAKESKDAPH